MDHASTVLLKVAIITAVMGSLGYRGAALHGDKEIRTNMKFYPRHYAVPPRWMRKLFSLPKRDMAKYLIFHLYLSLGYAVLAIVCFIILCGGFLWGGLFAVYMIRAMSCFGLFDVIVYLIFLYIFKHKKE